MNAPAQEIWGATLDDVWDVNVVRLSDHVGILTVKDSRFTDTVLVSRQVNLAYGARFGPDVADVDAWMEIAEAAVDKADPEGLTSDDD